MRQVADLIGTVFADELDAGGRSAVQEMRLVGRLSPFFGSALSLALFSDFVSGFVWVESGRVVGNVTLQRADLAGSRWRISNVAVDPEYRRRGIARSLMLEALDEIAERAGSWAMLQVRVDNEIGRGLYAGLGFTDVCQDGLWRLPAQSPPGAQYSADGILQPLGSFTGRFRLALDQAAQSPLAQWAEPIDVTPYQASLPRALGEAVSRYLDVRAVYRWGVWQNGQLDAQLEVRRGGDYHRIRFNVRPEARGRLEMALLSHGLQSLSGAPRRAVVIKHTADHAEGVAAIEHFGFRTQRVLLTMRRRVEP